MNSVKHFEYNFKFQKHTQYNPDKYGFFLADISADWTIKSVMHINTKRGFNGVSMYLQRPSVIAKYIK